jgi:hypothetical protein
VQRHDERDALRQKYWEQADRTGETEDRWRELHMHEVEIETAYGPGRRSGTADVPLFGDPDGTLSGGPGQLECRDDQRILAGVAEVSG